MRFLKYIAIILVALVVVGAGIYTWNNTNETEQVLEAVMV